MLTRTTTTSIPKILCERLMSPGRARCSEQEFIRLLKTHTASEVAKILNLAKEKVHERRRRIERAYEIELRPETKSNEEYGAIRSIEIKNGCVIVGSDAHYWPGEPPTMHRAMVKLIKQLKPEVIIANGDMFDGSAISRFPSIGWERSPMVKDELQVVQDRMDELYKAYRNARFFWTAGNHDLRFESRLAAVAPEYRGIQGIHLKDHIPGWTPCWAVEINKETPGWTEIRHREKGGVHAGYRNTIESGVNIVTGHDHMAKVTPFSDRRGIRYGVQGGMMADSQLDPQFRDYCEAKRGNWQSAITILTYIDGELLMPELCLKVRDGLVEFRGERFAV
jgi:hypothetical protein